MAEGASPTFHTLVKSLLRPDKATPEEVEASRKACKWLTNEIHQIRRYCLTGEIVLLGLIYDHWVEHKEAPSLAIIRHHAKASGDSGLNDLVDAYEASAGDRVRMEPEDLPSLFQRKVEEGRVMKAVALFGKAATAAQQGLKVDKGRGRSEVYKGPRDAFRYLFEKLDEGVLGDMGSSATHGSFSESADTVARNYRRIVDPSQLASQVFHTGIRALDEHVHPKRGHFVGIKGGAKSGKTRFGRTWMYYLLCQGYNVMHLSYEQLFMEELVAYACIHSHNAAIWGPGRGISNDAYWQGRLTVAQREFLERELIPDIRERRSLPGELVIRQPDGNGSWDEAMIQVALTNHQVPLDALYIDYIAAMPVPERAEERTYVNRNIQAAKTLAMTFDNNRGLLVVSPFHINREEENKAGQNGGRVAANACYMYSQVEKAVNEAYYVYRDDKLDQESCVMLGTSIHRHGKLVPPFRAAVEHACGTFHSFREAVAEENLDGMMDML